jgi:hypothetical protein
MRSKADHIARIPLGPALGAEADRAIVLRGAFAMLRLSGVPSVPRNAPLAVGARWLRPPPAVVLPAARAVVELCDALDRGDIRLRPTVTPESILALDAGIAPHVQDRTSNRSRPGPKQRADDLMHVCAQLNRPVSAKGESDEMAYASAFIKACCAHLALLDGLPWINGCTARIVELGLLLQSGVLPLRSAPLLCEHYERTVRTYRREVMHALEVRRPDRFIEYAAEGLVQELRRQLDEELQPLWMRRQWSATWEACARSQLVRRGLPSDAIERCVALVLSMGEEPITEEGLSTRAAQSSLYEGLPRSTLRADTRRLLAAGLLISDGALYMPNLDAVHAWPVPR